MKPCQTERCPKQTGNCGEQNVNVISETTGTEFVYSGALRYELIRRHIKVNKRYEIYYLYIFQILFFSIFKTKNFDTSPVNQRLLPYFRNIELRGESFG